MATFLGFPVAGTAATASAMGGLIPKESWRARAASRFLPGASGMSAEDRDAMMRQGLLGLAAGMASTGGQGIGAAIGNGLQSGLMSLNSGAQNLQEQRYRQQMIDRQLGDPAGLREFNAMTDGLSDEEKADARRVRLGLKGRATSAGVGFETWTDANGIPRPARKDPRGDGAYEVYYEEEGRWIPLGAAQGGARTPAQQPAFATPPFSGIGSDVVPIFEALRPAVERAESGGNPNAVSPAGAMGRMQVMPGTARDPGFGVQPARDSSDAELTRTGEQYLQAMLSRYADPRAALAAYNWGPGNVDKALQASGGNVEAMLQSAPAETQAYVPRVLGYAQASVPAGLGRGRTKEQEAAAVANASTNATRAAELQYLPTELGMRADAAVDQAGRSTLATETAKSAAAAQSSLPKAIQQADEALDTIDKLANHPGLGIITGMSGLADPRNYLRGTDAQGAQALNQQIQGQVFLQAFESLKGGGQITEVEGAKAEAAKARLNTRQSEADYKQALQDLREVIETGRQRALREAGRSQQAPAAQPGPARRLRYNPATGSLE